MQLGKLIGGVLLLGIGGAVALLVPPFLEKDSAEHADASNEPFDAVKANNAKEGDAFLFEGRVSKHHPKTFDHEIVVGYRMRQEKKKKRSSKTSTSAKKTTDTWVNDETFNQILILDIADVGPVRFRPDVVQPIEGSPFKKESSGAENKKQWVGIKAGQTVAVRGTVSDLDPLTIKVTRGQKLFVGSAKTMLEKQAASHGKVVMGVRIAGGVLGLIGLVLVIIGVIKD